MEPQGRTEGAVTLRHGVPSGAEARVAELYWEAFGRKLGPALNPPERGQGFLAAHLHHDRAVVALHRDEVVGVAGYQLGGRGLVGGGVVDVLNTYGWFRGLGRLALLSLLERRPPAGKLLMDGIAVGAGHRGHGVGALLLEEIARLAAAHGLTHVRLDVIDTNPRARALYERRGFTAVHTEDVPFVRSLMGFGAVTTMERPVAPGAGSDR